MISDCKLRPCNLDYGQLGIESLAWRAGPEPEVMNG